MAVFFAILLLTQCLRAAADESAALGTVQLKSSDSLIQNLLLVCDKNSLRYTITAGNEKGIKTIELFSGDKLINFLPCNGDKQCRMAGAVSVKELPSAIVTVSVTNNENREEKEKIKLNVRSDETKVYIIGSIPMLPQTAPIVIAENDSEAKTLALGAGSPLNAPAIQKEISAGPVKGPVIETKVKQNAYNDFTLNIVAKDDSGVDFVEILENNVFMDVQICDRKTTCAFAKSIKNRKPGEYKYVIKSMNVREGLSFQEEKISFSE